jgi:hypothetical protein
LGGVYVLVVTKDKPGQSILESYVRGRRVMQLTGRLENAPQPGQIESWKHRVELRRNGSKVEKASPIHVSGPHKIFEDGDMQPEIVALVPAPAWQLEIGSALSTEETWDDALGLAQYVAMNCRGAVWTGESGLVWPRQEREGVPRAKRAEAKPIDTLALEWFSHASKGPVKSGQAFLDVLRENFSELRPYRFGMFEPLQGQLGPEDDGPFLDAWKAYGAEDADIMSMLSLKGKRPFLSGYVFFPQKYLTRLRGAGPFGARPLRPTQNMLRLKLEFDLDDLKDRAALEKTVTLFVAMAKGLGSFYAHGYVERGYLSSREDRLVVSGLKKQYPLPMGHEWFGIPPVPTWLSWFGRPYKSLVTPTLSGRDQSGISEEEGGVFVRLGEYPADLDQLQAIKLELPGELLARRDEDRDLAHLINKLENIKVDDVHIQASRSYKGRPAELIPKIDD